MNDEELLKRYPALAEEVRTHPDEAWDERVERLSPAACDAEEVAEVKVSEILDEYFYGPHGGESEWEHVPLEHHLVLMQPGTNEKDPWVVVAQGYDKDEIEEKMVELDDNVDGYFEVQMITVVTQTLRKKGVEL